MEHLIPFVITKLSATELKDGRLFGRIKVYATISISGGPPTHNTEFTTHVDMEGNNNPKWNTVMDFRLHDPSLQNNLLYLNFNFHCRRNLGYKFIGGVIVLINHLLAMISSNKTASQAGVAWLCKLLFRIWELNLSIGTATTGSAVATTTTTAW
ncbi:hypothetical protein HYC85_032186 [Camellia sinensis]|uniref:C2 domain-containing protein n=1 Tax=Camellia sinensis TaxID=4442 RepID=A0A7J7FSF7_CAMSI|nr:hypothetical protein HYC85_032186 [Camellia sinensis]